MECGGLPPLLTAGGFPPAGGAYSPCAANGGEPPLRKRRQAAALHTTARGLSTLMRNLDLTQRFTEGIVVCVFLAKAQRRRD